MIDEAMLFLRNWKWYLAAAAAFILMGVLAVAMIFALVGITLFAASSSGSDQPSVTSGKNNRQSRRSDSPVSTGSIAPELVGTWHTGSGGGDVDYTGKSRYRSNRRQMYRIAADGAVEYTFERETLTIMQCVVRERKIAGGKAATEGDTLVIDLIDVTSLSSDSCDSGDPTERNLPDETLRLNWRFKEELETTRLCFDETDGEVCYDRKD